jgi:hypothetical protein
MPAASSAAAGFVCSLVAPAGISTVTGRSRGRMAQAAELANRLGHHPPQWCMPAPMGTSPSSRKRDGQGLSLASVTSIATSTGSEGILVTRTTRLRCTPAAPGNHRASCSGVVRENSPLIESTLLTKHTCHSGVAVVLAPFGRIPAFVALRFTPQSARDAGQRPTWAWAVTRMIVRMILGIVGSLAAAVRLSPAGLQLLR